MDSESQQDRLEKEVFRRFSKHYPEMLNLDSLRKMKESGPDLKVDLCKGGTVAFELSEIIDEGMSRNLRSAMAIKHECDDHYNNLPSVVKEKFRSLYGNCFIHLFFCPGLSLIKRRKAIPAVFRYLLNLSRMEKVHLVEDQGLKKVLPKILLSRRRYIGPIFDIEAGGGIADPLRERIDLKFAKSYGPCELLLYYDLQPEIVGELTFGPACDYAAKNIDRSSFVRLWVYSKQQDKVLHRVDRVGCIG